MAIHNTQRERCRDRSVNGITTTLESIECRLRCQWMHRRNNASLTGRNRSVDGQGEQQKDEKQQTADDRAQF